MISTDFEYSSKISWPGIKGNRFTCKTETEICVTDLCIHFQNPIEVDSYQGEGLGGSFPLSLNLEKKELWKKNKFSKV